VRAQRPASAPWPSCKGCCCLQCAAQVPPAHTGTLVQEPLGGGCVRGRCRVVVARAAPPCHGLQQICTHAPAPACEATSLPPMSCGADLTACDKRRQWALAARDDAAGGSSGNARAGASDAETEDEAAPGLHGAGMRWDGARVVRPAQVGERVGCGERSGDRGRGGACLHYASMRWGCAKGSFYTTFMRGCQRWAAHK